NPSTGPTSIPDMIERSKTTPGGLTYGSTGTNSSQHLSIELLKRVTGANLVHVPYRGSAPAVVDVIGGPIPLPSVHLPRRPPPHQGRAAARVRAHRRQAFYGGAGVRHHCGECAGLRAPPRIHRAVCSGRTASADHREALARGRPHSGAARRTSRPAP